jgi:NIPSNAP
MFLNPPVRYAALIIGFVGFVFIAQTARTKPHVADGKDRVFELRTYTCEPGRLDALNARFRDHTARLFEKHGMTNVGYWTPADEPRAKDTLIYLLAHDSREAAKASWNDFISDPEWHKARDASEADGKIVRKVESVFLNPTGYSAIK